MPQQTTPSEVWYASSERTSQTDDLRIRQVTPLPPPEHLIRFFPIAGTPVEAAIGRTRNAIRSIMQREDDRLLVVMGPCSIHDPVAAVEYAKQRTQFGRAIGLYQSIKHKLADVHIALELARPLVYGAALSLADSSPDTARDVSAAKASASDAALLAARSALQTHGAIGFTAEHDLSLSLLRVQALRPAWGDPAAHRRRVLEAL